MRLWGRPRILLTSCASRTPSSGSWASGTRYMQWENLRLFNRVVVLKIGLDITVWRHIFKSRTKRTQDFNLPISLNCLCINWFLINYIKMNLTLYSNVVFCMLQANSVVKRKLKRLHFTDRCWKEFKLLSKIYFFGGHIPVLSSSNTVYCPLCVFQFQEPPRYDNKNTSRTSWVQGFMLVPRVPPGANKPGVDLH